DVSGFADAIEAMRQYPREPGWDQDPVGICRVRMASLKAAKERTEQRLASPTELADPLDRAYAFILLGQLQAYQGRILPAIAEWQRALETARDISILRQPIVEALGIAYLQKAAMDNGALKTSTEPCLFCPGARLGFTHADDANRAIEYFTRYLGEKPD